MGDTDIDFFLETLKQLIMSSKVKSIIKEKHQLESLEDAIKYMRGFLKVTEKKRKEHSEVMNLDHPSLNLEIVQKEIKTLMTEVKKIYDENMCDINGVVGKKLERSFNKSEGGSSSSGGSNTSKVIEEKVVVGFKEDVKSIFWQILANPMAKSLLICIPLFMM